MKRIFQIVILATLCSSAVTHAADWKDDLEEKLKSTYALTKVSKLSVDQVTEPGTVFLIQKDGIYGDVPQRSTLPPVRVQDGKVKQPGGFTGLVTSTSPTMYHFRTGERLYLTDVKVGDDKVTLSFVSADSYTVSIDGSSQQTRYRGQIQFDYAKNYLRTVDVAKLKADFDAVIPSQEKATAVQTKTIELGQTTAQVEAILGKPETIVNLGSKVTYTYKSMKVIFVDGKVSDVQ